MRLFRRRRPGPYPPIRLSRPIDWDIKITSAPTDDDGPLIHLDTEQIYVIWRNGTVRTTDGYLDLLAGHRAGWHVWIKPRGWTEPDERITQLDGTAALPDRIRPAVQRDWWTRRR